MTIFGFVGCSMCCGPYDFDYPTYGGIHHRANPSYGRLGSVFSDHNNGGGGPSADSNLKPHPEPEIENDLGLDADDADDFDDLDDLERADEDLDDDLEGLDDELEELDRKLEELDGVDGADDELESIEPLEDISLKRRRGSQAKSNPRPRAKFPRRRNQLR